MLQLKYNVISLSQILVTRFSIEGDIFLRQYLTSLFPVSRVYTCKVVYILTVKSYYDIQKTENRSNDCTTMSAII